jgi:hypothetical protein
MNKYTYSKVIQQNFSSYGWEDVSEYPCNSKGLNLEMSDKLTPKGNKQTLLQHDLKEYKAMGYPCRIIFRRQLNNV